MDCLDEESVLAFLDGNVDDSLRTVIESHLAECPQCADLVATCAGGDPEKSARRQLGEALSIGASLEPGATVGRYVILNLVGRGGMGEVYAAYDSRLERKVALKLLRDSSRHGTPRESTQERLLREAQSTARLSHPNVVVVYDAGAVDDEIEGARVYLAMEFVEGLTLSEWLAAEPRSWRAIRDVFVAAGEGLMAAHEAGLVHRDFKPPNVMITGAGAVRVMDFGLASDRSEVGSREMADLVLAGIQPATQMGSLTGTGALVGTPLYMAPEQFLARPTDARTDQFAFCITLYEALYRERPFPADSFQTLREAVLSGRVRDPAENKGVPAFLRKIVFRGLQSDPSARYPSMRALLRALKTDPARRRRIALIGAVAAAFALVALVGAQRVGARGQRMCHGAGEKLVGVWERDDAGQRRSAVHRSFVSTGGAFAVETWTHVAALLDDYAHNWTAAYTEACEATHVRGDQSAEVLDLRMGCLDDARGALQALTNGLANADDATVIKAVDAAYALPPLERCADIADLRAVVPPPANPAVRAHVSNLKTRLAQEKALFDTGKWANAQDEVERLLKDARATQYEPLLAEALLASSRLTPNEKRGRTLEESVWMALAGHRDDIAAEAAGYMVAYVVLLPGSGREGERWEALAESLMKRLGPGYDRIAAVFFGNRAVVQYERGDFKRSAMDLEQTLDLQRKALPATHPDISMSLSNLACIRAEQGEGSTALALAEEALAIDRKAYGDRNPALMKDFLQRGVALRTLGRYEEAEHDLRSAVPLSESLSRAFKASDIFQGLLTELGKTLLVERKYRDADGYLARAQRRLDLMPRAMLDQAENKFALAQAEWALDRNRPEAVKMAMEARELYRPMPDCQKRVDEIDAWLSGRARGAAHTQSR